MISPRPNGSPHGHRLRASLNPAAVKTVKVKPHTTVSVALSKEQFDAMSEAIANWREVQRTLKRMEQITRENIFRSLPDTKRRKPLTKKVLALS